MYTGKLIIFGILLQISIGLMGSSHGGLEPGEYELQRMVASQDTKTVRRTFFSDSKPMGLRSAQQDLLGSVLANNMHSGNPVIPWLLVVYIANQEVSSQEAHL